MSRVLTSFALTFSIILIVTPANAATKIGATCKTLNAKSTANGVLVKCVQSGKKLVWQKVVAQAAATPSVAQSAEPIKLPTGFADLEANRKGISQAAWNKVNEAVTKGTPKVGSLEIYTGPKTKPYFDDYPKPLALVSKLFSNKKEPTANIVIRYKFEDLAWAESKVVELLPKQEVEQLSRNENGKLVSSNCRSENCQGSKQLLTSTGVNLILQGVPKEYDPGDLAGKDRFFGGMLEAHEYFHSLQRIPMSNKPLEQKDYPPVWFVEGSAEWVQNAAMNSSDFKKYKNYFQLDCPSACAQLTKKDITKILTESTNASWPDGYDYWLNYSLGSIIVETLVATNSPDSIVTMYEEMANKAGFEGAFKKVYGIEWKEAIPILAGAISSNLQGK